MTHHRTVLDTALRTRIPAIVDHALDPGLTEEVAARVAWSCIVEPGDGIAGRLVQALGAAEALAAIEAGRPARQAAEAAGVTRQEWDRGLQRWRPRLQPDVVRGAVEAAAVAGARLLAPYDARWPTPLRDLGAHAPLCLWVRGDLAAPMRFRPAVAIVGARAATSYGEHVAIELSSGLAMRGVAVISGAAYGIDGAAHRAALAAEGATLAFLAGGVDRPYPAGNAQLIDRIAVSGAVLSEAPCGGAPTKWRFLQRNRLIAALADATVVVEAGWRSGSLNTAHHASELGRPLGSVPGPVTSAASAGCHRVLREHDARCITGVDDVLELLGIATSAARPDDHDARHTDDRARVLDALSARASRGALDVARRCGMSVADVEAVLGLLSLTGEVAAVDGGWRLAAATAGR
ncbi:MAG: DNA-processing protein DprA [Microbacterium sp.]